MAEKRWTPQQLAAIESDGTLTVLSAAAGSGKTTVLVEKALRMLLDEENKTPADRLLIVTFSNASAKEFKNRIEKGINEAIKNNPDNAYIKSQKVALQKADISTIHSFCIKLTRENFEALDIAPDFTICDEAQSFAIHEKAVDLAMEYGYGKENFRRFASIFGKSSQDKQIREFLKDMFYYFSALPNPQKRALQLAQMDCDDFARSPVYRSLWSQLEQQIEYAEYLIQREVQLMEEGDVTGYRDGILANSRTVDMLCNACKNNDVFLIKSITAEKLASLGRVKKGEGSVYSEAIKTVNGILSKLLDEINEDVQYLDGDLFAAQTAQTKGYIQDITDVFVFYSQKLMELKKEQKAFEFSDFEHFAVQLLMDEEGNPTPLALSLRERYVKIMEDEFQDTSYVQDMIFNTIAQPKEKNLFVVGDVKQSIYGFRKASPEILLEKRSRGEKSADLGNTIVLPNNFRSEVNVIKAVNLLFENIMTKYLGGVDYCDGEQLQPAPGKTDSGSAGVSILVANDKENEANMVAQHIYTMVQNGYSIVENGVERSVKYGDFCILMRNKKHFDTFSEALSQYGIKAFVNDDKPLLETREVESVISLLRVINNPLQEVYLTAGMFGDIFDFTLDEILQFKLKNKKENLYNLLAQSENEKAQQFLSVLRDFAFVAKIYSPDKLVDYIISKTGYYRNLAFGENGSVKRENIRRFISFAKGYVTGYRNSLGDFIRYIDLVVQTGKSGSDKAVQPPDTVAIMTMHTSKGLEFPVVFVSGLGTAFNRMDRSKRLMIDPVLGMATYANESFGYNRSTAGIQAIRGKILKANGDDEMRLLYVALTRAKNRLFLTAQYTNMFTANTVQKIWDKTGDTISRYALAKANTPMEWILTGYRQHLDIFNVDGMSPPKDDVKITFDLVDVQPMEIQQQAQQGAGVDFCVEKAKENFASVYPHLAKTRLPIKVSVGEIAKAAPAVTLRKPVFARQNGFSAAEKGTQMHLFAQHSDMVLARADIDAEIDRLCGAGVVDRRLLNKKQIEKFVSSPVAEIILNGDTVHKEKEFLVPYSAADAMKDAQYQGENVMVQGVIDCIVINGDSAYIIDYKTDRVNDMDTLYRRYAKQLEMYRYAGEYLYGIKDIKCIIYSFYLGEYMQF